MRKRTNNTRHPGGRPPKMDKEEWGQITCVLKHETIERIRLGADSKHFGEYLQAHLDRYPPPTREHYLWITQHIPAWTRIKGRQGKVPVLYVEGPMWKTPEEKKWFLEEERAKRRAAREERKRNAPPAKEDSIDFAALRQAFPKAYPKTKTKKRDLTGKTTKG